MRPGHTLGSMVYEVFNVASPADTPTAAFTGDTLFCGGCGALFECSAKVLHGSLQMLVARLPPETLLFPGHEYTEMLLQMAVRRDRDNEYAHAKLREAREKRRAHLIHAAGNPKVVLRGAPVDPGSNTI